ncbi:MAG: hypothetical protein QOI48_4382, partial [Solirubrobacteraceae bacterium]|nr:hypothetical protein [Solirubrobacteraceae bacterium]
MYVVIVGGGKGGPLDNFVGDATKYVVRKA